MMAGLAPVSIDEQLAEELRCAVCLEFFNIPVLLPCTHTFCKKCVSDILRTNNMMEGVISRSFRCPTCREAVILHSCGVDSLPVNRNLDNLVRFVTSGTASPFTEVIPSQIWGRNKPRIETQRHCSQHDLPLGMSCSTCKNILCRVCADHHNNHLPTHCVKTLESLCHEQEVKICSKLPDLKRSSVCLGERIQLLEDMKKGIDEHEVKVKDLVERQVGLLTAALKSRLEEMHMKIHEDFKKLKAEIDLDGQKCRLNNSTLQGVTKSIKTIKSQTSRGIDSLLLHRLLKDLDDKLTGMLAVHGLRGLLESPVPMVTMPEWKLDLQDAEKAVHNLTLCKLDPGAGSTSCSERKSPPSLAASTDVFQSDSSVPPCPVSAWPASRVLDSPPPRMSVPLRPTQGGHRPLHRLAGRKFCPPTEQYFLNLQVPESTSTLARMEVMEDGTVLERESVSGDSGRDPVQMDVVEEVVPQNSPRGGRPAPGKRELIPWQVAEAQWFSLFRNSRQKANAERVARRAALRQASEALRAGLTENSPSTAAEPEVAKVGRADAIILGSCISTLKSLLGESLVGSFHRAPAAASLASTSPSHDVSNQASSSQAPDTTSQVSTSSALVTASQALTNSAPTPISGVLPNSTLTPTRQVLPNSTPTPTNQVSTDSAPVTTNPALTSLTPAASRNDAVSASVGASLSCSSVLSAISNLSVDATVSTASGQISSGPSFCSGRPPSLFSGQFCFYGNAGQESEVHVFSAQPSAGALRERQRQKHRHRAAGRGSSLPRPSASSAAVSDSSSLSGRQDRGEGKRQEVEFLPSAHSKLCTEENRSGREQTFYEKMNALSKRQTSLKVVPGKASAPLAEGRADGGVFSSTATSDSMSDSSSSLDENVRTPQAQAASLGTDVETFSSLAQKIWSQNEGKKWTFNAVSPPSLQELPTPSRLAVSQATPGTEVQDSALLETGAGRGRTEAQGSQSCQDKAAVPSTSVANAQQKVLDWLGLEKECSQSSPPFLSGRQEGKLGRRQSGDLPATARLDGATDSARRGSADQAPLGHRSQPNPPRGRPGQWERLGAAVSDSLPAAGAIVSTQAGVTSESTAEASPLDGSGLWSNRRVGSGAPGNGCLSATLPPGRLHTDTSVTWLLSTGPSVSFQENLALTSNPAATDLSGFQVSGRMESGPAVSQPGEPAAGVGVGISQTVGHGATGDVLANGESEERLWAAGEGSCPLDALPNRSSAAVSECCGLERPSQAPLSYTELFSASHAPTTSPVSTPQVTSAGSLQNQPLPLDQGEVTPPASEQDSVSENFGRASVGSAASLPALSQSEVTGLTLTWTSTVDSKSLLGGSQGPHTAFRGNGRSAFRPVTKSKPKMAKESE